MLQYKLVERGNPSDKEAPKKIYARPVKQEPKQLAH